MFHLFDLILIPKITCLFFLLSVCLLTTILFGQIPRYESLSQCVLQIMKERNLTGNKMFDIGHKPKFMVKADTDVISRVAQEILTQDSLKDLKKK